MGLVAARAALAAARSATFSRRLRPPTITAATTAAWRPADHQHIVRGARAQADLARDRPVHTKRRLCDLQALIWPCRLPEHVASAETRRLRRLFSPGNKRINTGPWAVLRHQRTVGVVTTKAQHPGRCCWPPAGIPPPGTRPPARARSRSLTSDRGAQAGELQKVSIAGA